MLNTLIVYIGRAHPVIIHFPIAFLIVGAIGEVVGIWYKNRRLADFVSFSVIIGCAGAAAAVATGWLFALQVHRPPDEQLLLSWHRWLGLGSLPFILTAAWSAGRWMHTSVSSQRWTRRGLVWMSAVAVILTAHLGAAIVWGSDFWQ